MNIKTHPPSFLTIFLLIAFLSTPAFASDRDKEKRWADQITDSLLDGEAVFLNDGKVDFLAIDTPSEEQKDTAIIVIHGVGIHPNWPMVIQPLRVQLAENGWSMLSLQMPILTNDSSMDDYKPLIKEAGFRIDAGIRYLAKAGAKKIVIIAHSLGSLMASQYLSKMESYQEGKTKTPITAFIGIGMGFGVLEHLKKIKLPILDLYGENDLLVVLDSAALRMKAAKDNENYKQVKMLKANHFFENQNKDLLKVVIKVLVFSD